MQVTWLWELAESLKWDTSCDIVASGKVYSQNIINPEHSDKSLLTISKMLALAEEILLPHLHSTHENCIAGLTT